MYFITRLLLFLISAPPEPSQYEDGSQRYDPYETRVTCTSVGTIEPPIASLTSMANLFRCVSSHSRKQED